MTSTVRTNDPTKLPGIPKAPAGATAEEKRWYDTIAQIMEIRLGLRGDPRDRAITLRELISSGLALDLKAAPFDPNAINSTNIGFMKVDVQGKERNVVIGAEQMLRNNDVTLVLELPMSPGRKTYEAEKKEHDTIVDILKEYGYEKKGQLRKEAVFQKC